MNRLNPFMGAPMTTGKYLVVMRKGAVDAGIQALRHSAGAQSVVKAADFPNSAIAAEQLGQADTVVFDHLGVAVVSLPPQQLASISSVSDESNPILSFEEERFVFALSDWGIRARATQNLLQGELKDLEQPISSSAPGLSIEYLRGYRDGVTKPVDAFIST